MNTIPSTFDEYEINSTMLWGRQTNPEWTMDISVIMLNSSGSHLKTQSLENLLKCGFKSVICVEPSSKSFNLDEISKKFPTIKFVIPLENVTDGILINSCVSEMDTKYFLVLRDSFNLPSGFLLKNLAENITKEGAYCVVPRLLDKSGSSIVTNFSPSAHKGKFRLVPNVFIQDGISTLYPFDFIGLYDREKFVKLGGFDYTITSSYWQNVDLALRSWLWGEKTVVTTKFQLSYADEVPIEKSTPDVSYLRFYLKNILPKFKFDHGSFPRFGFLKFFTHSSCGFFEALRQYKEAKNWVLKNKFRFKKDMQYLIENWNR